MAIPAGGGHIGRRSREVGQAEAGRRPGQWTCWRFNRVRRPACPLAINPGKLPPRAHWSRQCCSLPVPRKVALAPCTRCRLNVAVAPLTALSSAIRHPIGLPAPVANAVFTVAALRVPLSLRCSRCPDVFNARTMVATCCGLPLPFQLAEISARLGYQLIRGRQANTSPPGALKSVQGTAHRSPCAAAVVRSSVDVIQPDRPRWPIFRLRGRGRRPPPVVFSAAPSSVVPIPANSPTIA